MNPDEIKYVRFTIAPCALAHTLLALDNCGIVEPSVTLSDGDLMVSIDRRQLEKVVYKLSERNDGDVGIPAPEGYKYG